MFLQFLAVKTCCSLQLLVGHLFAAGQGHEHYAWEDEGPAEDCRCRHLTWVIQEEESSHKNVEDSLANACEQKEEIPADAWHIDTWSHNNQSKEAEINVEEQGANIQYGWEKVNNLEYAYHYQCCSPYQVKVPGHFEDIDAAYGLSLMNFTLGSCTICLVVSFRKITSHF